MGQEEEGSGNPKPRGIHPLPMEVLGLRKHLESEKTRRASKKGTVALTPSSAASPNLIPEWAWDPSARDPPMTSTLTSFTCHSLLQCHCLQEARTNHCPLQNRAAHPLTQN